MEDTECGGGLRGQGRRVLQGEPTILGVTPVKGRGRRWTWVEEEVQGQLRPHEAPGHLGQRRQGRGFVPISLSHLGVSWKQCDLGEKGLGRRKRQ